MEPSSLPLHPLEAECMEEEGEYTCIAWVALIVARHACSFVVVELQFYASY